MQFRVIGLPVEVDAALARLGALEGWCLRSVSDQFPCRDRGGRVRSGWVRVYVEIDPPSVVSA